MAAQMMRQSVGEAADVVARPDRLLTVLFVGRLATDERDTICRVRNISEAGLMIETRRPLKVGQRVHLDLRGPVIAEGEVRWESEGRAGIRTDAPLPVALLLDGTGPQPGHVARSPRFSAACPCEVRFGDMHHAARIADISQKGARIVTSTIFERHAEVVLKVGGMPLKAGKVRWSRNGSIGLALHEPLSFDQLGDWLENGDRRFECGSAI